MFVTSLSTQKADAWREFQKARAMTADELQTSHVEVTIKCELSFLTDIFYFCCL